MLGKKKIPLFTSGGIHSSAFRVTYHHLFGVSTSLAMSLFTHGRIFPLVQLHGYLRIITSAMTNPVPSHCRSCALPRLMRSRQDGVPEQSSSSAKVCLRQRRAELDKEPKTLDDDTGSPPSARKSPVIVEPSSGSSEVVHCARNRLRSRHRNHIN